MVRGVARASFSIPPDLLAEFDTTIKQIGYDRSKAVQAAIRGFLTEHKWVHEQKGTLTGALVMIYDHEVKGLEETLTDIQHSYNRVVVSAVHTHIDERHCLEVITVRGYAKAIQSLAQEMMSKRGVKQLKVAVVTP